MKFFSLTLLTGSIVLFLGGCTRHTSPAVAPEGCWLDETGVQALEVVRLDDARLKIQSAQGMLEGVLSGDTLSAPTPPPLEETIRMIFRNDTALYEILGTHQRFYRVTGTKAAELCPADPVVDPESEPVDEPKPEE